jgi:hypothetical protein
MLVPLRVVIVIIVVKDLVRISQPLSDKPFFPQSSITLVDMTTSHSYVVVSTRGIDIFVSCLLERLFKWATYGCASLATPSSLQIIDFLDNDMVS